MLLLQQNQGGLERRLSVIGIPRYCISGFIQELVKWESCSGVDWTIKRLKSLKVDLIRRQSGLSPLTWIRKNRKGDISGVVGSLFRWADKSDKNFELCVQAFMAYTYYIHGSLTDEQKEKFLCSINPSDQSDGLDKSFHNDFSKTVRKAIRMRHVVAIPHPLVTYRGSPEKRAPRLFQTIVPQSEKILDDLLLFNTDGGLKLFGTYSRIYKPLLYGLGDRQDYLDFIAENTKSLIAHGATVLGSRPFGGEIHFLQEPGGKLRSIASPLRIHQEALRPFGTEIYRLIQSLPWDCTFDQSKAHSHIQSHLWQGGQVHSVDLSSATDHFPLSLQLTALKAIFCEDDWDHINLFEEISRGIWKSELGDLSWSKGQPLGLYPSFGSFTLTHGLLLLHLAGGDFHNQFFVLGDDVVIMDDKLHSDYISMLDRMSCPWSPDKSLSSNKLSEFAGKIITSKRIIPQMKWRKISDDNFLDICRLLGRKSYCLLSSKQKRVFDQVCHLCDPIGLNFSLPDDNLEKMVERTLDFYSPEKRVLGSLMGLRRRINKLCYSSSESFNFDQLNDISATFDEKVKSALAQTVFSRWSSSISIGLEAFESLPEALGLSPRLPFKEVQPSRLSTLQRYQRLLNR